VITKSYTPELARPPIWSSIVEIWRSYQFEKIFQRHYQNRSISGNDHRTDCCKEQCDWQNVYGMGVGGLWVFLKNPKKHRWFTNNGLVLTSCIFG